MYKLPYFTESDQERILAVMKQFPFAVVTGAGKEYPVAAQLPLHCEVRGGGKIFLTGHMMKNTDHHLAFENNNHVLAVFSGPDCYVSASWYSNPSVASTWNYISVQAAGIIRFTDEQGTLKAIESITQEYEGRESTAAFDKLPDAYIKRLVNQIIGFEIEVTHLGNVFKLSQNHDVHDKEQIIDHLQERTDEKSRQIAAAMLEDLKKEK